MFEVFYTHCKIFCKLHAMQNHLSAAHRKAFRNLHIQQNHSVSCTQCKTNRELHTTSNIRQLRTMQNMLWAVHNAKHFVSCTHCKTFHTLPTIRQQHTMQNKSSAARTAKQLISCTQCKAFRGCTHCKTFRTNCKNFTRCKTARQLQVCALVFFQDHLFSRENVCTLEHACMQNVNKHDRD